MSFLTPSRSVTTITIDASATLTVDGERILTKIIRTGDPPHFSDYWVGHDDEDQLGTHFDRKFCIPPCPAVVTYSPVPAINFDEGADDFQHWKEIKLLNGATILARRVTSLNCPLDKPEDTFSLLPLFTMQNISDFSARLNDELDFKLSCEEERHAIDVKETVTRLGSQSEHTVKERDALKGQLQSAKNQINEMQSELARVKNTAFPVNHAPPVVVGPALSVAAPLAPVPATAPNNNMENMAKHLKSLSSTVHYLQRCQNQQSRVTQGRYYLNPIPEYSHAGSSESAIPSSIPFPNPIGQVNGPGATRSRNNRNRNRNRNRNKNRNAAQNAAPTGLDSVPSSANFDVPHVGGSFDGLGRGRGQISGRGNGSGRGRDY